MSKLEIDGHDLTDRVKNFTVHCKDCDGTNTEFVVESREEEIAGCWIWCVDCKREETLIE